MSMKRTPEWYEAYQRKQVTRKANAEIAWTDNVMPVKLERVYPLVTLCRQTRIAEPVPEYAFAKAMGRRWRFDYCWPLHMLALEVNGGVWTQGRHTRGQGAIDDMEKMSEAAIMGYRVLYATPQELDNGIALDRVIRALTDREAA